MIIILMCNINNIMCINDINIINNININGID